MYLQCREVEVAGLESSASGYLCIFSGLVDDSWGEGVIGFPTPTQPVCFDVTSAAKRTVMAPAIGLDLASMAALNSKRLSKGGKQLLNYLLNVMDGGCQDGDLVLFSRGMFAN